MSNTTEANTGHFIVSIGATTQPEEVIARNIPWQSAIELAESKMNLMGGNWKQLYKTSTGTHFYQLGEYETTLPDLTNYVFIGGLPFFGEEGTHA